MKSSIEKLQKVFTLEASRGYDNGAVMGGLSRLLPNWESEAQSEGVPPEVIQLVISRLADYHRLSPNSRKEALKGLWQRIRRTLQVEEDKPLEAEPTTPLEPGVGSTKGTPAEFGLAADVREKVQQPPTQPKFQPAPPAQEVPAALEASLTVLSGVGPRIAKTLSRLGLNTLGDMLYFFPRRYDDYSHLKPINRLWYGETVTVIGTIENLTTRPTRRKNFSLTEALITDGTGKLRVTWFNQPWIARRLKPGLQVVISGQVDQYLGRLVMNNPDWEPLEVQHLHTNRIVPVYPLTARITQKWLRQKMHQVVQYWAPKVPDHLPEDIRQEAKLLDLPTALLQAHFPESPEKLKAARYRLAFDEIFLLQLGVQRQKHAWHSREGRVFETPDDWLQAQIALLPYQLTKAQQRALEDVRADLVSGHPMNRLLQGDVGSGKTVVAALALAMIVRHDAQGAFMAPTSILAEQHYTNVRQLLVDSIGALSADEVRLLVGATPESEKREIRQGLAEGKIKVVIGTHALLEDPVTFRDLQLAIIDEQHRFGVNQRAALRAKGRNPHLLVMTATPIPRSLALTIYGDLDLSVIDEMPPGRQEVETHLLFPRERERAYTLIRNQIELGRQAFIIYPLIEEGQRSETKAAVEEYERLQKEVFPQFELGLLHGRLKPDEKERVMSLFRDGKYHILVSTSVVEVGVDIPNATVMLIEGANRFGLAQLHQFRGRVGRGSEKSYCLLIPESENQAEENERLQAMVETNDGFVLAERDLQQRADPVSSWAPARLASLNCEWRN
jgi:ATP-dependent DNA helicase RecG